MSISATQWGSPAAPKRALLIHGVTMSSDSWEGVAQLLAADGFFVVAPNLLGHAWRWGTDYPDYPDYRVSNLAEDLRPYFAVGTSYDVIIGHALGGTITLSLLPFLPKTKETTVILVDPALELIEEKVKVKTQIVINERANLKPVEGFMVQNPAWSRRDCITRALGMSMCDRAAAEVFRQNTPWSFSGLLKKVPPNVKITVLVSDPKLSNVCYPEHIPRDVERLNVRLLTGVGHWIQYELPRAIMDEIPLPRTKL